MVYLWLGMRCQMVAVMTEVVGHHKVWYHLHWVSVESGHGGCGEE